MSTHTPKKKGKKKAAQSGADVGSPRSPTIASANRPGSEDNKDVSGVTTPVGAFEALGNEPNSPAAIAGTGSGGGGADDGQMGSSVLEAAPEVKHPLAIQSPGFGYSVVLSPAQPSGVASPSAHQGNFAPLKAARPKDPQAAPKPGTKASATAVKGKGSAANKGVGSEANPDNSSLLSPEEQARLDAARRAQMRRGVVQFAVMAVVGLGLLSVIWHQLGYLVVVIPPPASNVTVGNFSSWAAVGVKECSGVVRRVYTKGGSIGDAAVALTLCSCVALPIHCGLGGGIVALYYSKSSNRTRFIDGREESPSSIDPAFFEPEESSTLSLQSIAVPGFLRGLGKLRSLIGNNLPWNALFEEAIQLAKEGVVVSQQLADQIAQRKELIKGSRPLRVTFMPKGSLLEPGDILVQEAMARTLENLSLSTGPDYFYSEPFARDLVNELSSLGSIISVEDVKGYQARVLDVIEMTLEDGFSLVTSPQPTTGALILSIFGIVEHWYKDRKRYDDASFMHVFGEACKFAFGRRSWFGDYNVSDPEKIAKLSNKEYLKGLAERIRADTVLPHSEYADVFSKDTSHGTLPIILSAPNGDVVAILASLNTLFGSMVMSEKRGIIYNNLINDFDIPGQKNIWGLSSPGHLNILAPRRRPVSSMAPVFVFRKGQFFAGALGTGGGYITSGIAQVLMRILWFRRPLKQAVEWYRVHHQLEPDTLFVEATVDAAVHSYLRQRSHQVELVHSWPGIVVAMLHDRNRTLAIYDYRDRNTANTVDGS